MLAIQNQKTVTQEITVWRKRRQKQYQDRQPCQIRWSVKFAKVLKPCQIREGAKTKPT